MDKKLVISTSFDTKEFDRGIRELQDKLGKIQPSAQVPVNQMQANLGWGGGQGWTPQQYRQFMQQGREENKRQFLEDVKNFNEKSKLLDEQKRKLEDMKRLKTESGGGIFSITDRDIEKEEKRLKILQKEVDLADRHARIRGSYEAAKRADEEEREKEAVKNRAKTMSNVLLATGGALGIGAEIYKAVGEAEFKGRIARGAAVKNVVGTMMDMAQTPYGQAWMGEAGKSMKAAEEQDRIQRMYDKMLATAAGMAIAGGLRGGPMGFLASGGAAMGALSSENVRPLLLGQMAHTGAAMTEGSALGQATGVSRWLQGISKEQFQYYEDVKAKQKSENFLKALTAEQELNPLKDIAAKRYGNMWSQYLSTQRTAGLDYNTFHAQGGFLDRTRSAGFTEEMGMDMAQRIAQSGGSTRATRQAPYALQMERAYNLTNIGQVMGSLSRGMGGGSQTDEALVRILAKGTAQGLDKSDFAQENREFVQGVAQIIGKTGVTSVQDAARMADIIGGSLVNKTGVGIEGAKTAYERTQQQFGAQSGWEAVLEYSAMGKNPKFNKLSPMQKDTYAGLMEEDFRPGGKAEQIALQMNVSMGELHDLKFGPTGTAQGKLVKFGDWDKARRKLQGMGVTSIPSFQERERMRNSKSSRDREEFRALQTFEEYAPRQSGLSGVALQEWEGRQLRRAKTSGEYQQEEKQRRMEQLFGIGGGVGAATGKIEDTTAKDMAESQRIAAQGLREFKDQIAVAPTKMHDFIDSLINLSRSVNTAAGKIQLMQVFEGVTGVKADTNAVQAGGGSKGK